MKKRILWKAILICAPVLLLLATAALAVSGGSAPKTLYAVSNSHLDTIWSWDLEEVIEKFIPDTLHGNFALIEKYPAYQFNFEGAYRYQLMEEYYPEEFARLREYVASGNWNPIGSGIENGDVNAPSPEALFRNFLYGNNYFETTFGRRSRDIFLPDCFGFGFALPSVASHSNLIGFTTQKLSWGNTFPGGRLPFDIGMWYGPDGEGILANINGNNYTDSYDDGLIKNPGVMQKLARSPVGKNAVLYGSGGDRGGSPSEATVAAISEEVKAAKPLPAAWFGRWAGFGGAFRPLRGVRVQFAPPEQIFKDITEKEKAKLPSYTGELLLYQHAAGGYTSRAMSNRWNRRAETIADTAERTLTAADWLGACAYPKAQMEKIWTNVISHQFHDDMPGTSNSTAYRRVWNDYMLDIMRFAAEYENGVAGVASLLDTRAEGIPVVVNNPVAAARSSVIEATVEFPSQPEFLRVYDDEGNEVPSQIISIDGGEYTIAFAAAVDSMGYRAYSVQPAESACTIASGLRLAPFEDGYRMENEKYIVKINAGGDIAGILDKKLNKELLGQPIRLGQFDNSPVYWPSWELDFDDYFDKDPARFVEGTPIFTVEADGPARIRLRVERAHGNSRYTQLISLDAGGEIVAVDNVVDWNERGTLLKAVFDFTCENPVAAYDLGLGVIERGNNNAGNDKDHRKAEVPHQKWVDLTANDGGYGAAVLNDHKAGVDKPNDSTLRLTLIHTPSGDFTHDYVGVPARQDVQEVGENRFAYAICSHAGSWSNSEVQLEAQAFNQPMNAFQTVAHAGPLGGHYSFGSLNNEQVLLRAVKKAERSDEIVVRFNEGAGAAQSAVCFTLGEGIESAREIYASEEKIGPARVENGALVFDIGAFGVKSFALTLKEPSAKAQEKDMASVDLNDYYNADAYSGNAGKSDGGLTILGDCYPSELTPDSIVFAGVNYQTGDKSDGEFNAIKAAGQTIALPAGYTTLKILAASVRGDKNVEFRIGDKAATVEIADFTENVAAWDLYNLGQSGYVKQQTPAFAASHRHAAGKDVAAGTAYMFLYSFDLDGAAGVMLPDDEDIIIFAATVVDQESTMLFSVSPLHDQRPRSEDVQAIAPEDEDERNYGDHFAFDFTNGPRPLENTVDHKRFTSAIKTTNVMKDGADAVQMSGLDCSPRMSFSYNVLHRLEGEERIKVLPGTTLSYEMYAENKLGRYVAVDLEFDEGNMRDRSAVDQNGTRMHPSHAKTDQTGEWVTVACDLSLGCPDAVIKEIRLAYDHPEGVGGFSAYVRNITITTPEQMSLLDQARALRAENEGLMDLLAEEIARYETEASDQRLSQVIYAMHLAKRLIEQQDPYAQGDIALFANIWSDEQASERERSFAVENMKRYR